jgi:hypothetical protein
MSEGPRRFRPRLMCARPDASSTSRRRRALWFTDAGEPRARPSVVRGVLVWVHHE